MGEQPGRTLSDTTARWGLVILIVCGVALGVSDAFDRRPMGIVGFAVFLLLALDLRAKARAFRDDPWGLALLAGYVAALVLWLYLAHPFADHKDAWRHAWWAWHGAFLSAPALAPVWVLDAADTWFDMDVPGAWRRQSFHYPFAVGFWLLYALVALTLRLHGAATARHLPPFASVVVAVNVAVGAVVAWALSPLVGFCLIGLSLAAAGYALFPRLGVPLHWTSRSRRRELDGIEKGIARQERKMERFLRRIDGLGE